MPLAEVDGGDEHQQVHDQVDLRRHHAEDPVGARDRRDQRVEQRDDGRHRTLDDEDVDRDLVLVLRLEERRQIPLTPSDQQQPLRRARQPGQHPARRRAHERDRDDRDQLLQVEVAEEGVEGLHHARGQAQLVGRDHPADRQRRQDEDHQHEPAGEEHRARKLTLGLPQRPHVDRVHLHPRVREEVVDDQHQARDPRPLRDQVVGVHRRRRRVALQQVHHAEDHQNRARDQRPDQQPARRQLRDPARPATRRHEHPEPEHDHDHDPGVDAVVGEVGVEHVRERARHEPEQRRIVEDRHRELAPHRQQTPLRRQPLAHPAKHATRPARRQLRRHQRLRQQEDDRRHDIEEHARQAVDRHRRRAAQARHRRGGHERQRHPRDVRRLDDRARRRVGCHALPGGRRVRSSMPSHDLPRARSATTLLVRRGSPGITRGG